MLSVVVTPPNRYICFGDNGPSCGFVGQGGESAVRREESQRGSQGLHEGTVPTKHDTLNTFGLHKPTKPPQYTRTQP